MRRTLAVILLCTSAFVGGTAPVVAQDDASTAVVDLLDDGSGPRRELRYELVAGATQEVVMAMNTSISQRVNGQLLRGDVPQIEFEVSATVGEVAPDGSTTISYSYDDARIDDSSIDDATAENVLESLTPIIGLTGELQITDRGETISSTINAPSDLDAVTTQLIESLSNQSQNLTVPLPEEAIGVGAKWKAKTVAEVGGIETRQTATYELVELTDARAEIELTVSQRAPRQEFTAPGTDTLVTLLSSKGSGAGSFTLTFDQPLPSSSDLHVQVRQKLEADGDRVSQTVTINVFLDAA